MIKKIELTQYEIDFLKRYGIYLTAPVKSKDIRELLPKTIQGCTYRLIAVPTGQWAAYYDGHLERESIQFMECPIEALYELLVWCYKYGYVQKK